VYDDDVNVSMHMIALTTSLRHVLAFRPRKLQTVWLLLFRQWSPVSVHHVSLSLRLTYLPQDALRANTEDSGNTCTQAYMLSLLILSTIDMCELLI
jgi:hypothetical protein